ncbi:MAG: DUF3043 domain-containing protein [Candidatus Ancillula sp.]|jgi:hypothetical protein|nr:DUF3043 domain-containing protein [Candidatus Ancillula sp.]
MNNSKNAPTPKRKDAQKRNFQPIVSDPQMSKMNKEEKKVYKKAHREEVHQARIKEQEALRSGDERYLPARDKGPTRRFIREQVDTSRTLAEFFLPVAIVALFLSGFMVQSLPDYATLMTLAVYIYIVVAVVQLFFRLKRLRKILVNKFGDKVLAKGSGNISYAVNRMIQPRIARLPKPQKTHIKSSSKK